MLGSISGEGAAKRLATEVGGSSPAISLKDLGVSRIKSSAPYYKITT